MTQHEALNSYEALKKQGLLICFINLYSFEPIDAKTLLLAFQEMQDRITVGDCYPEVGIGEVVKNGKDTVSVPLVSLAVRKKPKSGKPMELLAFEEISTDAIIKAVKANL